jgi:hypothetical protein
VEPVTLALFPLSIVVFPGEELKLHIFEPRYKQLVHDCLKDDLTFGIPPFIEGKSLVLGTELKLKNVSKVYANGNMDIVATAIGWFEINEFFKILHGKLYPGGIITRKPWDNESDLLYSVRLVSLIEELYDIMKINNIDIPDVTSFKTYHLAHKVGLNILQEMELLSMSDEVEKQFYLLTHLEHLLPILKEAETLRKKAEMNGHFQHLIPPI